MKEIRFHGRGGQGAVTAAELLAIAVGEEGGYSQAFPFFGVERRGAPVTSFCRIDARPIRVHEQVYAPDAVVVLDASLLSVVDVSEGLKKGGVVVINSKRKEGVRAEKVFTVDATGIALEALGRPIVNTAMLGALAKAAGVVKLESILKAVSERFPPGLAEKNKKAVEACFNALEGKE